MKWKIKGDYLVIRIPLAEMEEAILEAGTAEWNEPVKVKAPKAPAKVEHTDECLSLRKAEVIYTRQWPVHCRTCNARGWIEERSTGQKRQCPRCLEFALCPRCGSSALRKVSTEDGTYVVCENEPCQWNQMDALRPSAIAAGLSAPVWRCNCEQEALNA